MPAEKSIDFWLARLISFLFHPIWLPLMYVALEENEDPQFGKLFVLVSLCLVVFPGLVALGWMYLRDEVDFFVMAQANGIVPLVGMLLGLAFFAVANGGFLPDNLFQGELMAIGILLVFISLLVTLFWKISIHMIGWGAVAGFAFVAGISTQAWLLLGIGIPISVAVAWARMRLGSHDIAQILVGFGTGLVAALIIAFAFP